MRLLQRVGLSLLVSLALACGDEDTPPGPKKNPPGTPTIAQPAAAAGVQSPITVAGTSESGAAIAVTILQGSTEVGTGAVTTDTSGNYSVSVTYTGATVGADLTIRVIASNADGPSSPATVTVFEIVSAPTVTTPAATDTIETPVQVTGTAAANATVTVEVLNGTTVIGTGTGAANGSGAFDQSVSYTPAPVPGAALTVRAMQTANGHDSDWVTVSVVQLVPTPVITTPAANDMILTPVQVTGTAEPNAAVTIEVLNGTTTIGTASATADGSGDFDQSVTYAPEPAAGTPLTVRAKQTVNTHDSDWDMVSVTQDLRTFTLSGSISQAAGNTDGTVVYVRLFDSAGEVIAFSDEVTLTATDATLLPATPYSFVVPAGTYYIRAFRDSTGPTGPDGFPTLSFGEDAQVGATAVTLTADSTGNDLVLTGSTDNSRLNNFAVYTSYETFEARPPEYNDGNLWQEGDGLCGGFYMRVEAWQDGSGGTNFSAPMVRPPTGVDLQLRDDGGCGQTVHNNTNLSYDWQSGDQQYSVGVPDPDAVDHAGDYTFYFFNTTDDFAHVEIDNIAAVVQLDRKIMLSSHSSAAHVDTLQPTFGWFGVTGAASYDIRIDWDGGGHFAQTDDTFYTVPPGVIPGDDISILVTVSPRDIAAAGADMEARADGIQNYLVIDTGGDTVISLQGTITDDSGHTGDFLVAGTGNRQGWPEWQALVVLSADGAYTLAVLPHPNCSGGGDTDGYVEVIADVDDSGELRTSGNDGNSTRLTFDACSDQTGLDVLLRPAIVLLAPPDDAASIGPTPTFTWENYAVTYLAATGNVLSVPGGWSMVVWIGENTGQGGGFPSIIWALPNTATSLDFTALPAAADGYDLGRVVPGGPGMSPTDLSSSANWSWGAAVLPCDFADYDPGTFPNDPYSTCLSPLLGAGPDLMYATSAEWNFSTRPSAPTITAPTEGFAAASPLTVTGVAQASAAIDVRVLDDGTEIGSATGTALVDGTFSIAVTYTEPSDDTLLTVEVTQADTYQSDPAEVWVFQGGNGTFALTGTIDQVSGNNQGWNVHVRLYRTATDVTSYLLEQIIPANPGENLTTSPFSFTVPDAAYYVRAFRDASGPGGSEGDGYPTLGVNYDPQVAGTLVTVSASGGDAGALHLADSSSNDAIRGFDVFANNESFEPEPPRWNDAGNWVPGEGLCRGYYLRMETYEFDGTTTGLAPKVRTPSGGDIDLLDDGGCGETTHDNLALSYDQDVGDSRFSAGIPSPTAQMAGTYTLWYLDANDFMHIEEDHIAAVVQLDRRVPLTNNLAGTWRQAVDTTEPTLTWDPVTGANGYDLSVRWDDTSGGLWKNTNSPSYTVEASDNLPDNVAIEVRADPVWRDGDVDARAVGSANYLTVDTGGNSIEIGGTITNNSGVSGRLLIFGTGDWDATIDHGGSLDLPGTVGSYTLNVLPACGNDAGEVEVVIDVDDSGDRHSSGNRSHRTRFQFDACTNVTHHFVLNPAVELLLPVDQATGTTNTPLFTWTDYETTFPGTMSAPWSYIVYAMEGAGGGGFPEMIWGLPNTATALDMTSLPSAPAEGFDVILYDSGTASPSTLANSTDWTWNVAISNCDYDEYVSGTASVYTDCIDLILGSGSGPEFFAEGVERSLTTN